MGISLQLLAYNEGDLIGPLLERVQPWVREIVVVVDDRSTDRTMEIAKQFTNRVYPYPLNMDFGAARNFALEKAREPWILQLDADEWPTECLLRNMNYAAAWMELNGCSGMAIRRHNLVAGEPIGASTWERHVRLFDSRLRFIGRIHEHLDGSSLILPAPEDWIIQHYKTSERQEMQNVRYQAWEEQRAIAKERYVGI